MDWRADGSRSSPNIPPPILSPDESIGDKWHLGVIQSLADTQTQKVWDREHVGQFGPDLQRAAQGKLRVLNAADTINGLRVPPGNRPEKLTGDRDGQHSSRTPGRAVIGPSTAMPGLL